MESKKDFSKICFEIFSTQWFFLFIVIVIIATVTNILNPLFLTVNNIRNIFEQISVLGIVATGATILIISGNFDISVGALIGLSACVMAMLINQDLPIYIVIFIGILVCVLGTVFNGILSIAFQTPSFIISLATQGIYTGTALALTTGVIQTIYGKFETLGSIRFFGVIPLIFLFSVLGYAIVYYLLKYTQLGRRLFAIGSNEKAAHLSGLNIVGNKLLFFALNGVFVGVASTLLLSRLGAALPSTGAGIELQAIGAVVIGGVPINGGRGNIIGTFMGVLLMGMIGNVLNILRVNPYLQEIAFGSLIILSIAISAIRTRMNITK